jgi:hypothetical protein
MGDDAMAVCYLLIFLSLFVSAVMKDNNAPLGHYGVRPGAKLRLMGSNTDKVRIECPISQSDRL